MAAGLTQITIQDAGGTNRTVQVWSSNGSITGNLSFLQTIAGADETNPVSSGNALPVSGTFSAAATAPYAATAKGYQQLAGISASTALTVPGGATFAIIQCEAVDARWRDDGSAPTASVGMLLYAGNSPQTFSGDLSALRFIQTAAGTIINVSYYA